MEYQVEVKEGGLRALSCTFTASEVLAEWKKAASVFGASFRMAGFRPGHAPLEVLERQFFRQISETVTDALVSRGVEDVLARESLCPVSGIDYEGEDAVRGKAFRFRADCCVLEDGEIPDLESLHIREEAPQADPVQESLFLRDMLGRASDRTFVTEGRPLDGDVVEVEVTGKMDGRELPGMKTGSCRMRLMPPRPGEKVPDLDPIVRKLCVGETGSGTTPCPENYPDPSMRGRDIELVVTLRGIEREKLPELTDQLARDLGFRDAATVRAAAHARALEMDRLHKLSEGRRELRLRLEGWEGFDAPSALVRHCQREAMRRSRQYLRSQFESTDALKNALSIMKKEAEEKACGQARARALLLGWAKLKGMDVSAEEWKRVIDGRAARRNRNVEEYRRSLARTGELFELRAAMLEEQALNELMKRVFRP